ncbi:MAG: anti-sigma B factor antagonist [Alteromonadaceae bacterium]|jgi:anti-sigma B factor antagonist
MGITMTLKRERGSNKVNGLCKLAIVDDMTIYAIDDLKNALNEEIDLYDRFDLNLSAVEEIDSAGIQLLLALRTELISKNKELKISSQSEVVTKIMESYDVIDIFNIGENA